MVKEVAVPLAQPVSMAHIDADVPIPKQMHKFWPSLNNKIDLQQLTLELVGHQHSQLLIILSGCVVDDEFVPAELIDPEKISHMCFFQLRVY